MAWIADDVPCLRRRQRAVAPHRRADSSGPSARRARRGCRRSTSAARARRGSPTPRDGDRWRDSGSSAAARRRLLVDDVGEHAGHPHRAADPGGAVEHTLRLVDAPEAAQRLGEAGMRQRVEVGVGSRSGCQTRQGRANGPPDRSRRAIDASRAERPCHPGNEHLGTGALDDVHEVLEHSQPTIDVADDPAEQRQLAEGGADTVIVAERPGDLRGLLCELLGLAMSPVYRAPFDRNTRTVEATPRSPRRIIRSTAGCSSTSASPCWSRKWRISPCRARAPSSAELVTGGLRAAGGFLAQLPTGVEVPVEGADGGERQAATTQPLVAELGGDRRALVEPGRDRPVPPCRRSRRNRSSTGPAAIDRSPGARSIAVRRMPTPSPPRPWRFHSHAVAAARRRPLSGSSADRPQARAARRLSQLGLDHGAPRVLVPVQLRLDRARRQRGCSRGGDRGSRPAHPPRRVAGAAYWRIVSSRRNRDSPSRSSTVDQRLVDQAA